MANINYDRALEVTILMTRRDQYVWILRRLGTLIPGAGDD